MKKQQQYNKIFNGMRNAVNICTQRINSMSTLLIQVHVVSHRRTDFLPYSGSLAYIDRIRHVRNSPPFLAHKHFYTHVHFDIYAFILLHVYDEILTISNFHLQHAS